VLLSRLLAVLAVAAWLHAASQPPSARQPVPLTFADVTPVFTYLPHLLPGDLRNRDADARAAFWPEWARQRDTAIRARVLAGDEDSLVNFLLFGTTFTKQPRVPLGRALQIAAAAGERETPDGPRDPVLRARLDDLIGAMVSPGDNERLQFARQFFEGKGYAVATSEGASQIRRQLTAALFRTLDETNAYARTIARSEQQESPTAQFALRSKLYESRGLSSDTSLRPNFGIDQALHEIRAKGLLPKVARVAVVGPGLDFVDKEEGFDFYPQQSLQPFAIVDSLLRLNATAAYPIQLTTFDLSPRVNAHLAAVRRRSLEGQPTVLHTVLPATGGTNPAFRAFAGQFADRIGKPATPPRVPDGAGPITVRAVNVRPGIGQAIAPVDVNIVLQRLDLPDAEKFDLIVGTNVFLYYEEFQQALAMLNIERMLKPGGLLLTNNALVELPSSRLRSVGTTTVAYSSTKGDGDVIIWYRLRE